MNVSMGVAALAGATLVLLVVVIAIVALGMRALDRAQPQDVPVVTEQVMRVLRDTRQALQNRVQRRSNETVQQDQMTAERRDVL